MNFCLWHELKVYHHYKRDVNLVHQRMVESGVRFNTQIADLWKQMEGVVENLPTDNDGF